MKTGSLFLLASLFVFAPLSSAFGFEGKWSGKGTYIFNGELTQCSQVELSFSETAAEFKFGGGGRGCDKHTETFYPVSMQKKDGKLMFAGQVVGTYTDKVVTSEFRMPDGNSFRNWRMSMRREGNNLMYEESRIMDGEQTPLISFAGMLQKQ